MKVNVHARLRRRRGRGRAMQVVVAAVVAAALLVVGCGDSSDDASGDANAGGAGKLVINSYGGPWGDAINLAFVQGFEDETGIDVELLATADPAKSKVALDGGNKPPEDILNVNAVEADALTTDGLTAEVDYDVWDPATLEEVPDWARGRTSVAWGGYALALCYDKRKFPDGGSQPRTWADYWDTDRFPGKRGMQTWGDNDPQPELALMADGVPAEDLYPIDIDRAFDKLAELAPSIPQFGPLPLAVQEQLLNGEVTVAPCFVHRAQKLVDQGAPVGISLDHARIATDSFVVWRDAPNRENAMKFLAYMMERQPQAHWAEIGYTVPVNERASEEIDPEIAKLIPSADDNVVIKDESWYLEKVDGVTNGQRMIDRFNAEYGG